MLLSGIFPKFDHEGNELTHPYRTLRAGCSLMGRAACIASAGDWAWYKVALNLTGWKGEGETKRCCWLCKATLADPNPAFDFSRTAAWRRTKVSQRDFWADSFESGGYVSGSFSVPGFILDYIRPDFMHTCCLGVVQSVGGSILWELFKHLGGNYGTTTKATCAKLLAMVKLAAKSMNLPEAPFADLTVGMIGRG